MPEILPFPNASASPFNVPSAGKLFVTPGEQLLAGALPPAPVPTGSDSRKVLRIAIGIAAAFILYRMLIHQDLPDSSPDDAKKEADRIWEKTKNPWVLMATSAILAAYKLGSSGQIADEKLEVVARGYALEMGEYIHQTSSIALSEGVESQLLAGWSDKIAWQRAKEGYGLDGPQMRSYLTQLVNATKSEDTLPRAGQIVPESFKQRVQTMLLSRSDRIGESEAWASIQSGKALNWLFMVKTGRLSGVPKKRWITAEDELVCLVCGPLHGVSIPVGDMFESKGHKFFAPGVHPNCRCELQLIEDMPNTIIKVDEYKRDWQGRFAHVDSDVRPAERVMPERAPMVDFSSSIALLQRVEQNLQTITMPETDQKLLVTPAQVDTELKTLAATPQLAEQLSLATPLELATATPQLADLQLADLQLAEPQLATLQLIDLELDTKKGKPPPPPPPPPPPREIGWGVVPMGLMDQFAFEEFEPLDAGQHMIHPITRDDYANTPLVVEKWMEQYQMHIADHQDLQNKAINESERIKSLESERLRRIDMDARGLGTSEKARKEFALKYANYLQDQILISEINDYPDDQALALLSDGIAVSDLDPGHIADASSAFSSNRGYGAWENLFDDTATNNLMKLDSIREELYEIETEIKGLREDYDRSHTRLLNIGNNIPSMEIVSFPDGFQRGRDLVIGKYKISPDPSIVQWNSYLVPENLRDVISKMIPTQTLPGETPITIKIYEAIPVEETEE